VEERKKEVRKIDDKVHKRYLSIFSANSGGFAFAKRFQNLSRKISLLLQTKYEERRR
jgi:hypothetical protein